MRAFARSLGVCSAGFIAPMRLAPLVALTSAVICGLLFGCSPAAMGLLLSSRTQENMITTAASSLQSSAK